MNSNALQRNNSKRGYNGILRDGARERSSARRIASEDIRGPSAELETTVPAAQTWAFG